MTGIDTDILTGRTSAHIARLSSGEQLHHSVVPHFQKLQESAKQQGFDLRAASSFRDHAAQLRIWNEKVQGRRPILDAYGKTLSPQDLSPHETIHAILRWSALPGASRHHWGTDFDVYDAAAIAEGYRVQLTPEETMAGGPFERLHRWLDVEMERFGFFRPYARDLGGVSPEPWHLSYAPLASTFFSAYTLPVFLQQLESTSLLLKDTVLQEGPEIYERYFRRITPPFSPGSTPDGVDPAF